ncbi:TPR-like protein [Aureobasidium subglaciale]|nr:TPR-like protein [Aureobasidium subglaciale]
MAAVQNGHGNGLDGHDDDAPAALVRFSHIPAALDVPLSSGDAEEAVEVNLEDLMDDPTELCTLLENENVARGYWMTIALAYAKQQKVDHAIDIVTRGLSSLSRNAKPEDKLSLLSCLCWLRLWQCREAPRLKPDTQLASEARNKEYYIHQATSTLNEASRISPTYPPLFLARGVLYLLRASLQPNKSSSSAQETERLDTLRQAAKCFEDSLRASQGRNMMAVMGKARALFSLGKYADALHNYQSALERAPQLQDPDPRIGIGCCFWQLGHKDDAHDAWQRALEVNPTSKIANILLGLYHLDQSAKYPTTDPEFQQHYKKAMTEYTQTAWKLDNKFPLTCATFGNYFILRKAWPTVERLARQAIEATDVNAIASDGWYLMARKEHTEGNVAKASDYYNRADQARGGDAKGYLPAKFGAAQLKILSKDWSGAKFRLESIVQSSKSPEAMTLLGLLYAEEVYANQDAGSKEDKSSEMRKAIGLLEGVRNTWKDPKKKATPDSYVLLNLARLYEIENPERSLQCLQQVEQMEMDDIDEEDRPDTKDEAELKTALREMLPPQLLNNMAAFHFQAERFSQARDLFQTALNACVKAGAKDSELDTDSLVTSISYNLARTYEAEHMLEEANQVYQGLLERHPDYTDARIRLAYIALRENPSEGGQAVKKLLESEAGNLDIRALYGYYIHKAKKRAMNPAEDQEQRHYKHTLQHHDKHDRYSLTGMGNLFLQAAREMRRDTDQDKEKRTKTYVRAIEFFDKALQLDPRNAYAAQGIAIALIEDKKDYATAIQIFTKVRETLKDASVFINMGHAFVEVKQFARAIESYEAALAKDRTHDPSILACLGRVWLMKGKQEKNMPAMKTALEFSNRALESTPDQVHFKFNVAFVQIQIAQLIYTLPEATRTLVDLENAAHDLDEAIESLMAIARAPNPPFPKNDIEQRANMGRNTMRKQLDRALQSQRDFEEKNASRLETARQQREAEIQKREDEKRKLEEAKEERRRKIAEERQRMQEQDREIVEQKIEEEAERKAREDAELTTDEETGGRKKRDKRPKGARRKKKGGDSDSDIINDEDEGSDADGNDDFGGSEKRQKSKRRSTSAASDDEDGEKPKKKKRRKLERKGKVAEPKGKFKSSEVVVDSDSDDDAVATANENTRLAEKINDEDDAQKEARADEADESMAEGEDDDAVVERRRKKPARVIDDDEDEDEDEAPAANGGDVSMVDETVSAAGNENAPDS